MLIRETCRETNTTTPDTVDRLPVAPRLNWTNIVLFLVLTFGISWTVWLVLRASGVSLTIYAAAGMFGLAAAAVLVRVLRKEGFADAGLRLVGKGHRGGGWIDRKSTR